MTTFSEREDARSRLYAANRVIETEVQLSQDHQEANEERFFCLSVLDRPFHPQTVLEAVQDAEAQYELGLSEDGLTVAEIADRSIRGDGMKIECESDNLNHRYRVYVDGIPGAWHLRAEHSIDGTILTVPHREFWKHYRVFPLDLAKKKTK